MGDDQSTAGSGSDTASTGVLAQVKGFLKAFRGGGGPRKERRTLTKKQSIEVEKGRARSAGIGGSGGI